ncbi:CdiA family toxin C-terminal domain-containing protein [Pseudomonas viridiflava]|uniref:CdiA family toxin C-terminal domain-containing protein n=1 Tax=Pseudomonas viridiflava TaxID=33069 RepID=UPI001F119F65|nr:CdiA family toxin C-terminal domain-containing protein [Pseudomonas viridiflava]
MAAGANEVLVADINKLVKGNPNLLSMSSQLVGLLAASTQSEADGGSLKVGAWVAQNGIQYNFGDHLPPGLAAYGQAATTQMEYMQNRGASAEMMAEAGRALARGEGFEGVQPATEFVKAWGEFMAVELSGLGLSAILGKVGSWFAIGSKGSDNLGLADNLLPEADFVGRGSVRPDLKDHLVDPILSGKQISGGNDLEKFEQAMNVYSGTTISNAEIAPGIFKVEYQLPNSKRSALKTVHDPKVYPDMPSMANEAAYKALIQYQATGKMSQEVVVGNIKFQVPVNIRGEDMYVPTAFPVGVVK